MKNIGLLNKTIAFCEKYKFCSQNRSLGHALDPADPPDLVSSTAAWDPLTTRAGGQDDGNHTKLPEKIFKQMIHALQQAG